MTPKLIIYLDHLLKNSFTPMKINVDIDKISPEEILELNQMVADGDLRVDPETGDMFIASREVYDKWQDILWRHYVDFEPGHRCQEKENHGI
nr:MAG TPA: hypothetical protein [Caudoviricetes sp.]